MIDSQKFLSCLTLATSLLKGSRGNILIVTGEGNSGKSTLLKRICELFPDERSVRIPYYFLTGNERPTTDPTPIVMGEKLEVIGQDRIIVACPEFEDWNDLDEDFVLEVGKNSNLILVSNSFPGLMGQKLKNKTTVLEL